jgi:hypothetical protein
MRYAAPQGSAYLEARGKPVAFYSDKHGVFRVNHPGALGGDGMTQFGRALHALNNDIICAHSSQSVASGRFRPAGFGIGRPAPIARHDSDDNVAPVIGRRRPRLVDPNRLL